MRVTKTKALLIVSILTLFTSLPAVSQEQPPSEGDADSGNDQRTIQVCCPVAKCKDH